MRSKLHETATSDREVEIHFRTVHPAVAASLSFFTKHSLSIFEGSV